MNTLINNCRSFSERLCTCVYTCTIGLLHQKCKLLGPHKNHIYFCTLCPAKPHHIFFQRYSPWGCGLGLETARDWNFVILVLALVVLVLNHWSQLFSRPINNLLAWICHKIISLLCKLLTKIAVSWSLTIRPLSAQILLYHRQKFRGGELSLPSEGRPAIY